MTENLIFQDLLKALFKISLTFVVDNKAHNKANACSS